MFFSYKKIGLFLLLFFCSNSCKKNIELEKISDYVEFNKVAAHLTCEKIHLCYNYIYRTFPKKLLDSSRIENCELHVVQNLEEKISDHNEKIQYLARSCYTQILKAPCKALPVAVISNPSCSALKKEIKSLKKSK